ncbi:MAG: hypothetical protein N3I35_08770 [Clostridia bacterium]|nr:hypothetical protein [Clostridia bacterium]
MYTCCSLCHKQTEEIDPITGVCLECMDATDEITPEYDDELDDEAMV